MGSQTKAGFSSTARLGLSLVHARGVGWMIGLAVAGVEYAASAAGARTPEEARAAFRLADPRLTIELVASEPQVSSPVAMSWDLQGRLFVAEMNDYPVGTGGGRIRLLEDRDGDARLETSRVFAEGVAFPNSVLAWNNGVLITAAPDLLFLKDNDGDGQADERRVLFTGFAKGNQQLRANGLYWGLDGWIYGANGRSDGEITRPGETNAISLRGHDFRFRPETGEFETVAGRSQFGLARDDWGGRFLSWNTVFARHDALPEAFLKPNPRIAAGAGLVSLLASGDDSVFPTSRAPLTFNRESVSHFNALGGLFLYRGGALPPDYQGNLFAGETLLNLVHRRSVHPKGGSYEGRRTEQNKEFLSSDDPWFH
ncbi:MAG: hypothetical protein FJ405_19045, partial [Verrucomicrobia bacterium]|nr:hypothetical protein [Verrucomicrobiota bacterium]